MDPGTCLFLRCRRVFSKIVWQFFPQEIYERTLANWGYFLFCSLSCTGASTNHSYIDVVWPVAHFSPIHFCSRFHPSFRPCAPARLLPAATVRACVRACGFAHSWKSLAIDRSPMCALWGHCSSSSSAMRYDDREWPPFLVVVTDGENERKKSDIEVWPSQCGWSPAIEGLSRRYRLSIQNDAYHPIHRGPSKTLNLVSSRKKTKSIKEVSVRHFNYIATKNISVTLEEITTLSFCWCLDKSKKNPLD